MVFEIFLFVVWIWILFTIITDLFRNHEMSGWLKAVWLVLLIFIPYLTALIYLIVYGSDMRERQLRAQAEAKHEEDAYIRAAAHSSPADELSKLHELVEKGALTQAEYDRAKEKLLTTA
ncbi:MAG: SHOCT domain-containing protein [Actinobacteria bacterium]|nr:SHOCT domain-containing protein [Actinomycetota bacterium]